jgi:hypothetical protein
MAMNSAEFEAGQRREDYEIREAEIGSNVHRDAHAHEFYARVLVLDGSITLVLAPIAAPMVGATPARSRQGLCMKSMPRLTAGAILRRVGRQSK